MKNRIQTGSDGSCHARGFCPTNVRRAALAAALVLGNAVALAQTNEPANLSAPIPLDQLGTVAGQQYQGDALGITATAGGAILRCGFQKLEGRATTEGLWLASTEPGAEGKLRLVATAVFREALDCGSPLPLWDQPCFTDWTELFPQPDMARGSPESAGGGARHSVRAEDRQDKAGAQGTDAPRLEDVSILNPQPSTLPATGTVEVTGNAVRFTRPGLTEEYSVSVDGVRQDFIIQSPPLNSQASTLNSPAGELRVELALTGARAEAMANGAKLTMDQSGRALAYNRLRVTDATGKELPARVEVSPVAAEVTRLKSTVAAGNQNQAKSQSLLTSAATRARLVVVVNDADAVYPVRIDPTFSDADWVSFSSGINGADSAVFAVAVDNQGNLYAGGSFRYVGSVQANHIAKWNGTTWSALGSGVVGSDVWPDFNPRVSAVLIDGTNVFVGGDFTHAGGQRVNRIARWDGMSWSALGSGVAAPWANPGVYALAKIGNHLYAGGSFTNAGGVSANYIARWDGTSWSALGAGVAYDAGSASVGSLAADGENLYAGGTFTRAGGVPANYIAKWDGSAWSALGTGINSAVSALATSGDDLYVGGYFTLAGGTVANKIAKWDGSGWSALGSGVDGDSVRSIAVSGSNLYAGGYFNNAGGMPAKNIAKWDGTAWSALGSGVDGIVYALQADNDGHLFVGGSISSAGGKATGNLAQANIEPQPICIDHICVDDVGVAFDCRGAAGLTHIVQRASDARFTQNVTTLHTTNAPPGGRFQIVDPNPPATAAFYRLLKP